MKKIYSLFFITTLSLNLSAQTINKSDRAIIQKTIPFNSLRSVDRMSGPDTLGLVDYVDFLPQFAPTFSPTFYTYADGGYVFGNNVDTLNACAQGYLNWNNTPVRVMGVLLWFGAKESDLGGSPTSKVIVKAWQVSANNSYNTDGSGVFNGSVMNWPGPATAFNAPDASADLLFTNIDTVMNYTYVSFANPPAYIGDFALGVDFSTLAPGDTAGLVSDLSGDAYNLDYAFHYYQNKWFVTDQLFSAPAGPYYGSGQLDNSIAIWPVVDTADCFSRYSTAYDSVLNTFNITVDPYTSSMAMGYHWDFGDGSTSTLASPSHTYAIDSLYNVCLKIYTVTGDSCEYCRMIGFDSLGNVVRTSGFALQVINPISVSAGDAPKETTVSVFPNPFNSQTTLSFSKEQRNTKIIVTDILGREIRSTVFSGKQYILEKGELKPGMYFVRTIDSQDHVYNTPVIIR